MQLPVLNCEQKSLVVTADIDNILTSEQNNITKIINNRNLLFFEEEVNKLDHWVDDLKYGLEQSIKDIDLQIKDIRRQAKIAPTLEEKLSWQKQQNELERARNKQRRELFDKQDEVDERREKLIEKLENKLNQSNQTKDLFVIRWNLT
jgi:hypothetical protein